MQNALRNGIRPPFGEQVQGINTLVIEVCLSNNALAGLMKERGISLSARAEDKNLLLIMDQPRGRYFADQ